MRTISRTEVIRLVDGMLHVEKAEGRTIRRKIKGKTFKFILHPAFENNEDDAWTLTEFLSGAKVSSAKSRKECLQKLENSLETHCKDFRDLSKKIHRFLRIKELMLEIMEWRDLFKEAAGVSIDTYISIFGEIDWKRMCKDMKLPGQNPHREIIQNICRRGIHPRRYEIASRVDCWKDWFVVLR